MFSKPMTMKMKKLLSCFTRQDSHQEDDRLRKKMVIVGDGECGKTCLVTRMATGDFVDVGYVPTVFETQVVDVDTGDERVELVISDTAGQEDYDRLRPFAYSEIDVVLICFSLADPDTLTNVMENWSPEIRYFCGDAPVILVGNKKDLRDAESSLSSSKASLTSANQDAASHRSRNNSGDAGQNTSADAASVVSHTDISENTQPRLSTSRPVYRVNGPVKHSEGAIIAKRIGAMAYFETSALNGDNVEELLLATTKAAILGNKKSKKFKPFTDTLKTWQSVGALAK